MASEYGLAHIEPGEIFRAAIAARTPIGVQIQPIVAVGELVPDSLTTELTRERLSGLDPDEGFVLDGFPRTRARPAESNVHAGLSTDGNRRERHQPKPPLVHTSMVHSSLLA
jgi:hypothetical protein